MIFFLQSLLKAGVGGDLLTPGAVSSDKLPLPSIKLKLWVNVYDYTDGGEASFKTLPFPGRWLM